MESSSGAGDLGGEMENVLDGIRKREAAEKTMSRYGPLGQRFR